MKRFTRYTDEEVGLLLPLIKEHVWWWDPIQDRHFKNEDCFKTYVRTKVRLQISLQIPYKRIPVCIGDKRTLSYEWDTAVYKWRLQIGK